MQQIFDSNTATSFLLQLRINATRLLNHIIKTCSQKANSQKIGLFKLNYLTRTENFSFAPMTNEENVSMKPFRH